MVSYIMSLEALREDIGANLRQMRLNANLSQQELAAKCGLARSTVAAFEAGKGGTIDTMILMLRYVQQLHVLDAFEVAAPQSPIAMARNSGKSPQRIKRTTKKKTDNENKNNNNFIW